jgi:hypothetical protein
MVQASLKLTGARIKPSTKVHRYSNVIGYFRNCSRNSSINFMVQASLKVAGARVKPSTTDHNSCFVQTSFLRYLTDRGDVFT